MMRRTRRIARRLALPTLGCALGILAPGGGSVANDADLFASASVPPNVMFMIDNSGSMNNIVWHPAFRLDVEYDPVTCPVLPMSDPDYDPKCLPSPLCDIVYEEGGFDGDGSGWDDFWSINDNSFGTRYGRMDIEKCSNTRDLFVDPEVRDEGNLTYWALAYLRWYFSDNVEVDHDGDGRTILEEILDPDDGQTSQCVLDEDPSKPATYTKYGRARITATKAILREVICDTNRIAAIRYGLAKFDNDSGDPAGGYVRVPIDDYTATHAADLEDKIDELEGEAWTPLSETLYNVYRYFQSRGTNEQALGANGTTRFPVYNFQTDGSASSSWSPAPPSPVTDDCQMNFVVLISDGAPTKDDFDSMDLARFRDELIGDYNDPGDEVELPPNTAFAPFLTAESCSGNAYDPNSSSCETSRYLDDIAKFMQEKDFQLDSSFPSHQGIDTYTVGFTTAGATNALLKDTAEAGNGKFFSSNNPEELTVAIGEAIEDILAKTQAFTAATVPASRATDGNNFFTTYFIPSSEAFWEGHIKLFEFNALGEIRDKPGPSETQGACALEDEQEATTGRCEIGRVKVELDGYWDAADEIPAPGSRDLYVSYYPTDADIPSGVPSAPIAFSTSLGATALGVDGFGAAEIATYDIGDYDITGITTAEELADAIIQYVRGCDFEEDLGSCQDRAEISNGTVIRGNKLWDTFHSNPVVVGPPNRGLREASYKAFASQYKHRKRVIYAGSNGGFVHGFNAGEYRLTDTADFTDAPGYDRGTGIEEFGFMAYPARQNIKDLPKVHGFYMDGSPIAGDVWLYPAADKNPVDITSSDNWTDWRTVLMGGMREGGRTIWALDVTDPPDYDNGDGESGLSSLLYPGYMWEFPCEAPACDTYRAYMGETWSEPVITRVKVKLNCDGDAANPCPTYDRWVAIFGAGYDPKSDPNPKDPSSSATDYDAAHLGGRAVFMIDITSGEVLAVRKFDASGSSVEQAMLYAFTASPAVFDLNHDGYADVVYFGDLGGNLWKWVIHDPVRDPINGTGNVSQPDWPFLKIFAAEGCHSGNGCDPTNSEPEPHFRSIFFPPTGAMVNSKLWLAFGTGERTRLDYVGTADAEKNRYYVMRDPDPLEMEPPSPDTSPRYSDAAGADFLDINSLTLGSGDRLRACESALGTYAGYYIEGAQGEKFVTDSTIFFGVVLAGSFVPTASADACEAGSGDAYVYGFDLFCAEGIFPPDPSNPSGPNARFIKIGEGLPAKPRVSVGPLSGGGGGPGPGPGPCQDKVIVMTSEADGFTNCPGGRPDSGTAMKSWRDF